MIKIKFIEYGKWNWLGYQAVIQLIDLDKDRILETLLGSTWPNPHDPDDYNCRLEKANAAIQPGLYQYKFSKHAHNNELGFDIDGNGNIPTICPNPNQNDEMFADHVDAHSGWKNGPDAFGSFEENGWRGSKACLTIMPVCWPTMQMYFIDGARGPLEVIRPLEKS